MTTRATLEKDAAVRFHGDLVGVIRESFGVSEKEAVPMADALAAGLKRRMGGLYIPVREIREVRDAAVLRDFTGRNHAEVIKKHGISQRTLYRIIGSV